MAHAIFTDELRCLAVAMGGDLGADPRAVDRVNVAEPFVGVGPHAAHRVTEHMVPTRREVDFGRREIPIPETVVGAPRGQRIALLALLERPKGIFEGVFARLDLEEHLVEGTNEKTRLSARADRGADGVVLLDRHVAGDSRELRQRLPNRGREA